MFENYFTCNTKQKTNQKASQDNKSAREELGAWKVVTGITVCYNDEYATDIMHILNKAILQEVPESALINCYTLM